MNLLKQSELLKELKNDPALQRPGVLAFLAATLLLTIVTVVVASLSGFTAVTFLTFIISSVVVIFLARKSLRATEEQKDETSQAGESPAAGSTPPAFVALGDAGTRPVAAIRAQQNPISSETKTEAEDSVKPKPLPTAEEVRIEFERAPYENLNIALSEIEIISARIESVIDLINPTFNNRMHKNDSDDIACVLQLREIRDAFQLREKSIVNLLKGPKETELELAIAFAEANDPLELGGDTMSTVGSQQQIRRLARNEWQDHVEEIILQLVRKKSFHKLLSKLV